MLRHVLTTALLVSLAVTGCGGTDLPLEPPPARGNDGVLTATVRIAGGGASMFVADEVVASLGPSLRGRELVIWARSYDLGETLAFVIDLNTVSLPGNLDLANHGALYLEPGVGLGGGDLLFDGVPQGTIELEGNAVAGSGISGRFSVVLPGYDPARPGEEITATLEGSFALPVVSPQP